MSWIKMAMNTYLSILNVNGLNAPIKRHRVVDCIKKQEPITCSLQDSPQLKEHIQIESEGLEKILHADGKDRKAGVSILISDKRDFKMKAIKKNKHTI